MTAAAPAVEAAKPSEGSSELRELVRLSWPIMLAQLGTVAMSLVDTAILGRVSVNDLAGASLGRSIGFASVTMTMGVATGLEPLASQAIGAGESGRAWQGLLATIRATLLLWIPSVAVSMLATLALAPLGVDADVIARARMYLAGQAPQMAFIGVFLALRVFLQAHGVTRPALVGAIVANVINLAACGVLVHGDAALAAVHLPALGLPRLGALGGGIALSFATLVMMLFVLVPAIRHRPREPSPRVPARTVWGLGTPIGFHMLAEYAVFTVIALLAAKLGARVVSAHQIALALASFMYMGALGVGGATAVRVGIAVGARRPARRPGLLGLGVGSAFMSLGAIAFALFPEQLVDLFTDEPDVIATGTTLLRIAALFQLFDGVQVVAGGALRGAGDVRFPFLLNLAAYWAIGLPAALLFGFTWGYGAVGLWLGITLGLVAAATMLTLRFVAITRGTISRV